MFVSCPADGQKKGQLGDREILFYGIKGSEEIDWKKRVKNTGENVLVANKILVGRWTGNKLFVKWPGLGLQLHGTLTIQANVKKVCFRSTVRHEFTFADFSFSFLTLYS